MAEDRLFYGAIDNATIFANGSNSFIRIRGDFSTSSKVITNVADQSGYLGINTIIPGQTLVASTYFPSGTIIDSVNPVANTITVADFPAETGTSGLARISPTKGQYFISSGSLTVPTNNPLDFFDITGSEDTLFQSSDNKFGVLLQQASTSSLSSTISGEFAQYEISRIVNRQSSVQASFYITSSDSGILAEESDKAAASGITSFAIVELSYSSSLAPIFNQTVAGTPAGGYEVAAYQIAVQEFLDDLALDVFYTGSEVQGNVSFIDFSGSAIHDLVVTQSADGKTGVTVTIKDSNADTDWYVGDTFLTASKDVRITGSLLVTRDNTDADFFIISSGSSDAFKVNSEGIAQFFAHDNAYVPTVSLGGLYFTSASAFIGLE